MSFTSKTERMRSANQVNCLPPGVIHALQNSVMKTVCSWLTEKFYTDLFSFFKWRLLKGKSKLEGALIRKIVSPYLISNFFFLHRDSEIMQQKQKAANERKSLQAGTK